MPCFWPLCKSMIFRYFAARSANTLGVLGKQLQLFVCVSLLPVQMKDIPCWYCETGPCCRRYKLLMHETLATLSLKSQYFHTLDTFGRLSHWHHPIKARNALNIRTTTSHHSEAETGLKFILHSAKSFFLFKRPAGQIGRFDSVSAFWQPPLSRVQLCNWPRNQMKTTLNVWHLSLRALWIDSSASKVQLSHDVKMEIERLSLFWVSLCSIKTQQWQSSVNWVQNKSTQGLDCSLLETTRWTHASHYVPPGSHPTH